MKNPKVHYKFYHLSPIHPGPPGAVIVWPGKWRRRRSEKGRSPRPQSGKRCLSGVVGRLRTGWAVGVWKIVRNLISCFMVYGLSKSVLYVCVCPTGGTSPVTSAVHKSNIQFFAYFLLLLDGPDMDKTSCPKPNRHTDTHARDNCEKDAPRPSIPLERLVTFWSRRGWPPLGSINTKHFN